MQYKSNLLCGFCLNPVMLFVDLEDHHYYAHQHYDPFYSGYDLAEQCLAYPCFINYSAVIMDKYWLPNKEFVDMTFNNVTNTAK